jgi:macrolide-specific efflux system membrane fusion protein
MNRSKKIYIIISAFAIICTVAAYLFFTKKNSANISYNENKVELGNIYIKILATGTVQPENRIEIKPPIPGRVEKVLIEEGDVVRRGQILAWMSSTERAALLDAARAKGAAELKKWEEIYPATPIISPLKGTIVLKNVEEGETFTSSDSLMSMSDRLTVKAQVDETDIATIQLKQEAEITLDAYPNEKILGHVDRIAFDATTVSNVTTYIVDVLPKSVPDFMRSGMTANVSFTVNSRENVLLIPSNAVKVKDGRAFVLLRKDVKDFEQEVVTGITNGKQIEITSGLSEGDIVLSEQIKLEKTGSNPLSMGRGNKPKK